jgi:histidine triad (HIT) family protein
VTAFFDYFPASSGHLVIVPNQHHENIFDIPEDTLAHLVKVSKKIAHAYKDVL